MIKLKKSNEQNALDNIRSILLKRLIQYQLCNAWTDSQMSNLAGVSRTTWFRWKTRRVPIPATKFGILIYRFKLDQHEIMEVPRKTDIHYKEFFDYGEEYKAYMSAGKAKAAIQVMRRAGSTAFDVLHSYDFSVDCVISNRREGYLDVVALHIFLGERQYLLEMRPSKNLFYKFCSVRKDQHEVLHEGCFSNSILKTIINYLDAKRVRAANLRKKEELNITNLIKKSRELEAKSAYE